MIFGYERVSSKEQNLGRQREGLLKYGVAEENIFSEKISGKNLDRPELQKLLSVIRKDDKVVVLSMDRLGRNCRDLVNLIEEINEKGVGLHFITEGIDTSSEIGKVLLIVIAAFAEMERKNIKERQRQGIELAKQEGRMTGRPKCRIEEKEFCIVAEKYRKQMITATEAAKILGISRATFYRRIEQFE